MDHLLFQYCPKLAVLSADQTRLLLCRRKGEADYNEIFSLIGGKMEHKDSSVIDALRREKTEEVGESFRVRVLPFHSVDVLFHKADGSHMILPHFYAQHITGPIDLNDEYSESRWVSLAELTDFGPKIENISWITPLLVRAGSSATAEEFVEI